MAYENIPHRYYSFLPSGNCPTVCVSGLRAGWENAREQKKPEARKMLINRADSRKSTARFVGRWFNLLYLDNLYAFQFNTN
jgi:hypothetical protein